MTVSEALQVFDMTEKSIPDLDPIGIQSLIMRNNSLINRANNNERQKLRHENDALETLIKAAKEYKYEQECAEKLKRKLRYS